MGGWKGDNKQNNLKKSVIISNSWFYTYPKYCH